MYVAAELGMEAPLHGALISSSCAFQAERHREIAISPKWGNERCLYLVSLIQLYLVLAGGGI